MQYVALLRGINVGGNNKIDMRELKACFEVLGFMDVRTYINSGNVIFASSGSDAALAETIEQGVKNSFGLEVPVVVRSQSQIAELAEKIPSDWTNDQQKRTDVLFLWQEVDAPSVVHEVPTNPAVDSLLYLPGALVWSYDRTNYTKTKMRNFIGSRVYKLMTARNINTVRKLNQLMSEV